GAAHERIQFNESTVWTGEPHDYAHKGAYKSLAQIRELLWAGKQKEAETLAMKEFMSDPIRQRAYQAFGDLRLEFPEGGVANYRRSLDLDTGIAAVEYTQGGVTFQREVFASHPDRAIVVRLSGNKANSVSFSATLSSTHEGAHLINLSSSLMNFSVKLKDSAIRFEALMSVHNHGGKRVDSDGKISIN